MKPTRYGPTLQMRTPRHRALSQEAENVCFEARAMGHGCFRHLCLDSQGGGRPARARAELGVAGWVSGGPPLPRLLLFRAGTLPACLHNRCLTGPAKWIIPKPRRLPGNTAHPSSPTLLLANKPDCHCPLNPLAPICVRFSPDGRVSSEHLPCAEGTQDGARCRGSPGEQGVPAGEASRRVWSGGISSSLLPFLIK